LLTILSITLVTIRLKYQDSLVPNGDCMKKSLVFTKSVAFEKTLIDKLEDYFTANEKEDKKINFSAEVTSLIEMGLKYRQLENTLLSGKKSQLGDMAATTGKARLQDLIKDKVEFDETALEPPKPSKGIRIQKL